MPSFIQLMAYFLASPLGFLVLTLAVVVAIHEYRSAK